MVWPDQEADSKIPDPWSPQPDPDCSKEHLNNQKMPPPKPAHVGVCSGLKLSASMGAEMHVVFSGELKASVFPKKLVV